LAAQARALAGEGTLMRNRLLISFSTYLSTKEARCSVFCCQASRKWLQYERSVGEKMRHMQMFLPTSCMLYCFLRQRVTQTRGRFENNKLALLQVKERNSEQYFKKS